MPASSLPKVKVDGPAGARHAARRAPAKGARPDGARQADAADAVALTGMPNEQAEPALKSLVATYRSHLAVTDEGELVYEFDPSLERRDKVHAARAAGGGGAGGVEGFQLLFKIWIVVTLVAYVVAFVAMMISLMVARSSSDRDDRRGGDGFGFPWLWFWLMPDLAPPGYARDAYGRPMQMRRPRNAPTEALLPVGVRLRVRPEVGAERSRARPTSACWPFCAITRGG